MKKRLVIAGVVLSMLISLTACGAKEDKVSGNSIERTFIATDSEWYGIDAWQLDETSRFISMVAAPFFQWDPNKNELVDFVCTNWKVAEDGLSATFDVPEGMYYTTGEQVEPEDVVASIEHGRQISPYNSGYSNISTMDVDGRTVTLHFEHFRSELEYYMTSGFMVIIDKDELDTMSNEELMWESHPYGPYGVEEYVSGAEIKLVANDGWKHNNPLAENKGAMKIKRVDLKFNEEDFTKTEEFKSGNYDFLHELSSDMYHELDGMEGVVIEDASYPTIDYFELNTNKGIFRDINVRKALALTIDRQAIVDVSNGMRAPAYSLVISKVQCHNAEVEEWFRENLSNNQKMAKELLAESGWADEDGDGILEKDGEKLEFTFYSWKGTKEMIQRMGDQLKTVGFKLNIETLDWNYIYEKISEDDYDTGIECLAWAEPVLLFEMFYYDRVENPGDKDEYWSYVEKIASEPDPKERAKMVGELEQMMYDNVNIIPLSEELAFIAYTSYLKGYKTLADGTSFFLDMYFE